MAELNNEIGLERSKMLIESLPYMKTFQAKTFVIKYGGSTMKEMIRTDIIQDLILLKTIGINPVIVHGGGAEITNYLTKLNIETKFVNGLRVTSKEAIEVAQMVLVGKVNQKIVASINLNGGKAIGLSGIDSELIIAKKKQPAQVFEQGKCVETVDLGFVGEIDKVNPAILTSLIQAGFIPVISPIAVGVDGESYNINADVAAGYVASALQAEKLIMLTDIDGIYTEPGNKDTKIESITEAKAREMINNGQIKGGMIPKVSSCIHAIQNGVNSAHIIDGGQLHSILLEVFTDKGTGTMVVA